MKYILFALIILFATPAYAQLDGELEYSGSEYSYWTSWYGWRLIGTGKKSESCSKNGEMKYNEGEGLFDICDGTFTHVTCTDGMILDGCSVDGQIEFDGISGYYYFCSGGRFYNFGEYC